jgi:hypothetical protein
MCGTGVIADFLSIRLRQLVLDFLSAGQDEAQRRQQLPRVGKAEREAPDVVLRRMLEENNDVFTAFVHAVGNGDETTRHGVDVHGDLGATV